MEEREGNGKEGAQFDLGTLQREDGIISRAILSGNRENSGVLAKAMTSITKNDDYRQELKTGYFTSPRKQMQFVLSLAELLECGVDRTVVIDLLITMKAGFNGGLMHDIFEALTHTTFNTNYTGKSGNRWYNKGEPRSGNPGPLS